ncbi:molybdopterin-guanine dinucleotide biosynthesis protein A [Silvibacterium bohemicum]|uniref:Probable molybdenum cofactor guanylyltransferase n=1 Tax=Silvibacterium bohemicum TaxID=1577686 RepID=A0A841JWU7_9BACT|nr:molybdenum cofactor guanylyltransferase [Silvibacterium bohemicum]MBB6144917.1 molybdopterin-guanine dinucleotide biosynthesis protein A [Silvibacterium bohemicum]
MNAFVLAGGLSSRMGRDKALLEWRGRPLIEHALDKLRSLGFTPRILGVRPDLARFAPVIPDNIPARGPLGGIEAALSLTDADLNLFLPVDLPRLPVEFLRWMAARSAIADAAATIPWHSGHPQPLCAVYHRRLLAHISAALSQGDGKVMRVIAQAAQAEHMSIDNFQIEHVAAAQRSGSLPSEDWPHSPPAHTWFENLNTPADLARANGS